MRVLIRDLAPGVTYSAQFRALSPEKAPSDWSRSFVIDAVVDTEPPEVPTNLTAAPIGPTFYVTWEQVAARDTDHYRLQIQSNDGVVVYKNITFDKGVDAGAVIDYTLTFEENRNAFISPRGDLTFKVQAVDTSGNASAFTAGVNAINPAPAAPTEFTVTGGIETIYGSWTPPTDEDIDHYEVFIGTTNDFAPVNTVYSGRDTQFTLPFDTTGDFYFRVYAVDIFGSKSASSTVVGPVQIRTATQADVDAPEAPTAPSGTFSTNEDGVTTLTVDFVASANTDNDLAGYELEYRPVGQTGWTIVQSAGDSTQFVVSPVQRYTEYELRIRAFDNSFNRSAWTAVVATTTAEPIPSMPIPTGVDMRIGYQTAMVFWDDMVLPIDSWKFIVQLDTTNTFNSVNLQQTVAGISNLATFTNLDPSQTYYARVKVAESIADIATGGAWSNTVSGSSGLLVSEADVEAVENRALSRGTDLVTNGTGMLGNNYNFSQFEYDPADAPVGALGSFWVSSDAVKNNDELIPISTGKSYVLTLFARQRVPGITSRAYTGLVPVDGDKLNITPSNYMYRPGTTTTLAADLNPGDTTMTLVSTNNWMNNAGAATYLRTVVFWDYVDATGKAWPPETYSRNLTRDMYPDGGIVGNTITLNAPYDGPAKPAGTFLSNGSSGNSYMYGALYNDIIPETWTKYQSNQYSGVLVQDGAPGSTPKTASAENGFPPGTAYVRVVFLVNRDMTGGAQAFGGISFSDVTAAKQTADTADSTARDANTLATTANQTANSVQTLTNGWKFSGKTTINGGAIEADTISAIQIRTAELAADTAFIGALKVGDANIIDLSADKIKANTSFVNSLSVKSTFTLGDATTDGVIQSYGYSAGVSGFKLAKSGLEINDGSIAAKALKIQFGSNLMPAKYADFEWASDEYNQYKSSVTAVVTAGAAKYGQQFMSIRNTSTALGYTVLASTETDYNIPVDAGGVYIVSAWVKAGAVATSARMRVRFSNAAYSSYIGTTSLAANGAWQRISGTVTIPAGVSSMNLVMAVNTATVNAGYDIDGVQIEKRVGAISTPSPWTAPSSTTIDGGQVRTGSMRSNDTVLVNGINQPAWVINVDGGAQFGDVNIRGNLYVGTVGGTDAGGNPIDADAGGSKVQSANYVPDLQGWIIRSDGFAEFRNLKINSLTSKVLDKPVQNIISTKLYDYMEDATLWQVRQGQPIVQKLDYTGAYSAKALLELTGDTIITRDARGVSQGLALEPETLYRITGRVRQITAAEGTMPRTSIGVIGFNDAGEPCGYDGSQDLDKQYEIAANREPLGEFNGNADDSLGWQTFVGYLRGRSAAIGQTVWGDALTDADADGLFDGFELYAKGEPNLITSGDFEGSVPVLSQAVNLFPDPSFEYVDVQTYQHGSNTTSAWDTSWKVSGTRSIKMTPTNAGGKKTNSTYIFPADPVRVTAQQRLLYPGGTFTVAATVRVTAIPAATYLSNGYGQISVGYRDTGGGTDYHLGDSDSLDAVGEKRQIVTFTVPDDADYAFIRLMCGHNDTTKSVWWDDVIIREGVYTIEEMNNFSGDTPADAEYAYSWQGTAGASSSVRTGGAGWTQYNSGTLGQMVVSEDFAISGGQSLAITGGGGTDRGAYVDLAEPIIGGSKIRVGFTGRQILATEPSQAAWKIALNDGTTSWQSISVPAHPDDNPATHAYQVTIPAGNTLSRIYVYNTGLPTPSPGTTVIDDVFVVMDASPEVAVVGGGQQITAGSLPADARSGVTIGIDEPEIDSYLTFNYSGLTDNATIGVDATSDSGGGEILGDAIGSNEGAGTVSLRLKTGFGERLTLNFYLTSGDNTTNASVTLSDFSLITGIGVSSDPYNPGSVHDNVRFIAPYVRMNEDGAGQIAQLDAFTIETFEAGNQAKMSTATGYDTKSITIDYIEGQDDNIDHAVRFYTGDESETLPGAIGQYVDGDRDNSLSLLIAAPRGSDDVEAYTEDSIILSARNANLLSNSDFEYGDLTGWRSYATDSAGQTNIMAEGEGYDGGYAARIRIDDITKAGHGLMHYVDLSDFPQLAYADKLSGSAMVKVDVPDTATAGGNHPMQFWMKINILAQTDTGKTTIINPGGDLNYFETTAFTVDSDATELGDSDGWKRIQWTWDDKFVVPENAYRIEFYVYSKSADAGRMNGDEFLLDCLQLEVGTVSPCKPQRPSKSFNNTDVSVIRNGLIINRDGSGMPVNLVSDDSGHHFSTSARPGAPDQPQLFLVGNTTTYTVGGIDYNEPDGDSRSYAEFATWTNDENGKGTRHGGGLRLYSVDDSFSPGRVLLFNRNNKYLLYSEDKFNGRDGVEDAVDIATDGWMTIKGNAPWIRINAKSPFSHAGNTGQFYTLSAYKQGDEVHLRGGVGWQGSGGDFTGTKTMAVLPQGYRPAVGCRFIVAPYGNGANLGNFVLNIRTDGTIENSFEDTGYNTQFATGCWIPMDGIIFSTAPDLAATSSPSDFDQAPDDPVKTSDTTPPSKPSNFNINARSSGSNSGSYTLKWKNSTSGDSAGVKILWRTDRYPSVTIPNSGKRTLKTDGHVITVSGSPGANKSKVHYSLPVNRTIYYRIVAYDKNGNHSGYISRKRYLLKSPITITADSSHTYRTSFSGTWDGPPGSGDDLYQGDGGYSNNGYRGCWFYGNNAYEQLNKGGVRRNPTKVQMFIYRQNSAHGTSAAERIHLWWHPHKSRPSGAPELHDERTGLGDLKRGQGKNITLPSGWGNGMASGSIKGYGVYDNGGDYIIYTGHNNYRNNGKLTIYHKG